jgi:hypothetical protein
MGMLKTIFGVDTSRLKKGFDRANNSVDKFSRNVAKKFGAAFSTVGIGLFFRKMSQDLDRIGKLAARGFSTDFVQDLGIEAEKAGTNIDAVIPKIIDLFKEINKGGAPSDEIVKNLERVGLTINDLKGLSMESLFMTVTKAIGETTNRAEANAAALAILKDGSGELTKLLKVLAEDGLGSYSKASPEAIASAEQFKDSMTVMGNTIMTVAAPAMTFLNYLLNFVIVGFKKFSAVAIGSIAAISNSLYGMMNIAANALVLDFTGAKRAFRDMTREVAENIDTIGVALDNADKDMQAFVDDMEKRKTPSILASVSASADDDETPTGKASKITKSTIADSMQRIGGGGRSVVAAQRDESIRIAQSQLEVQRRIATAIENQEQEKMR